MTTDLSKMSQAELLAFAKKMQEDNARIMAEKASRISFKVSMKGGISAYGLGRLPVTLHPSQWDSLLANVNTLKAFIDTNRATCDKQSDLYDLMSREGAAKGLKGAKLDLWIVEELIKAKNPHVSDSALKNAQERATV